MKVEAPQTPSVYLIDRSGCCFHSNGSLEDIYNAQCHLEINIEKAKGKLVSDKKETIFATK